MLSTIEKDHFLFSQGDQADAVHYIQTGQIKLTVISKTGKEATVGLLGPGDFVGQDCLVTGQTQRLSNAYALMDTTSLKIEAKTMQRALHEDAAFSDLFASFLLERNMRIHADLVDQLFNSSEKRLARLLLLLAQYGQNDGHTERRPYQRGPKNQSGDSGHHDRHHPGPSEFLSQSFPEDGLHPLQRWIESKQLPPEHGPA